jgi:hypothetical protein
MKFQKTIRWTARILALAFLLFGLPFYFGYGNPLPFINPDYSFLDNAWLSIFPLMFIGLGVGWKYEKIGGYLITIPLTLGLIMTIIIAKELTVHMLIPFVVGVLYLLVGYSKKSR